MKPTFYYSSIVRSDDIGHVEHVTFSPDPLKEGTVLARH